MTYLLGALCLIAILYMDMVAFWGSKRANEVMAYCVGISFAGVFCWGCVIGLFVL